MNDISQNMKQTEISEIPEVRTRRRKRKCTLKNKAQAKAKRARDKHPLRESIQSLVDFNATLKFRSCGGTRFGQHFGSCHIMKEKHLCFNVLLGNILKSYVQKVSNIQTPII